LIVTCALAMYVGGRTLSVWWRTRQVAELAIGANLLSIAIGGLLFTALKAGPAYHQAESWAALPFFVTLAAFFIHVVALYGGSWRIFRPTERWPAVLVGIATLAALWYSIDSIRVPAYNGRAMFFEALRGFGMSWAAFECFRYSGMLRRRIALGLADPMIAQRIRLWGIGAACQVVVSSLEVLARALMGVSIYELASGLILAAVLGLFGTLCVALAFFPPAAYVRAVAARAQP
jgi:hypothetical protein